MSRNYPADTQIQNFLTESYIKEQNARLGWYYQRQQNPGKSSKQMEVFRKKIEAAAPRPTEHLLSLKDTKPKNYHRRIINHDDNLVKLAARDDKAELVDMRPVSLPVRSKLYDGFTKEGKGRYQYLQARYQRIPEDKYNFPALNSWEYGWRLGDVIKKEDIKKPTYGRTRIVADTFYTRTGIPVLRKEVTSFF